MVVPGAKSTKYKRERDLVGLAGDKVVQGCHPLSLMSSILLSCQLCLFTAEADVEEVVRLRTKVLAAHPRYWLGIQVNMSKHAWFHPHFLYKLNECEQLICLTWSLTVPGSPCTPGCRTATCTSSRSGSPTTSLRTSKPEKRLSNTGSCRNISTIKGELLPVLVKKQFSSGKREGSTAPSVLDFIPPTDTWEVASKEIKSRL